MQFYHAARIIVGVRSPLLSLAALCALLTSPTLADWPQFLGPTRNGVSVEKLAPWPAEGPEILWQHKAGSGWSGPVVAGGKVLFFHRVADKETLECLDAATGKPLWKGEYDTAYRDDFGFDDGPRATPAVVDGSVYTFGADGVLACWELATGKRAWLVDTRREFKADKGFFGMVCSPLVEGDAVILNVGGTAGKGNGAGVAAFDKSSGRLLWRATDHEAGYSSPVAATVRGRRHVFSLTRAGLVALEPANGSVLWDVPFRARSHASVNAATPLVVGEAIFVTASYGVGGKLLTFDEKRPAEVWANDESLSAHYATPVVHEGHLYGFHGRQEQGCDFRCVELKTGKVKWSENGFGAGAVVLAGGELLILHEKGELIRAAATPDAFKVVARSQILGPDVRAYPALSGGLFFARDKEKWVCVNLRAK